MLPSCVRLLPGARLWDNLAVEGDQANRVLLMDHQVAQGRRQADAVFELRQFLPVSIAHRTG